MLNDHNNFDYEQEEQEAGEKAFGCFVFFMGGLAAIVWGIYKIWYS